LPLSAGADLLRVPGVDLSRRLLVGEALGPDHPRRGGDGFVPVTDALAVGLATSTQLSAGIIRVFAAYASALSPFEPRRARWAR
jgi:hypothetical protein